MYLVGDRIKFIYNGTVSNGTVAVIHENNDSSMTYWVDEDDGENVLLFSDAEDSVSLINPLGLDFI